MTKNTTGRRIRDEQRRMMKKGRIRQTGPIEFFLVRRKGREDGKWN